MTSHELYYKFNLLFNKNNEFKGANIPIEEFVILYNKESEAWLADYIRQNRHNSEILKVEELIVSHLKLDYKGSYSDREVFLLPENLFEIIPGTIISRINGCSLPIFNRLYKPEEITTALSDKFLKPSLAWQRGVSRVSNGNLEVYVKDFKVDSTEISYYKQLEPIDVAGYIKHDNTPSQDKDTTYSDFIAHQILNKVVTEAYRIYTDQAGFQFSKEREIKG